MLDLDFTEEQDMLRQMMRRLCTDLAPMQTVRDLEDDPDGIARDLWVQLGELGICGLMVSEDHGGSEMTLQEGVVVYEELGRALAPVPHFVSCVLAASAIEKADSARHHHLLKSIANGSTIVTPAWIEPGNGFSPRGIQMTAQADGLDVVLHGSKMHVYFAAAAEQFLVLARTGPADTVSADTVSVDTVSADAAIAMYLVPATTPGITASPRLSISSDTQYRVDFDHVRIPRTAQLDTADAWGTWNAVMNEAVILASAQAMGGAEYALEITAEYAKDRKQFGKALAEFQSISHYLANAKTELDGGKLLVYEAAWAHSAGHSIDKLAPMAKLFTGRVFRDLTAMAQQVFGGIGFTVESDIQLYFRRAKQQQIMWWDKATCEAKVADAILTEAKVNGSKPRQNGHRAAPVAR